jgi:hypothetical protein
MRVAFLSLLLVLFTLSQWHDMVLMLQTLFNGVKSAFWFELTETGVIH